MRKMIIITLLATFLAVNAKRQQHTLNREELISSMLDPNLYSNMRIWPTTLSCVAEEDVHFYLYNKEHPNDPIKLTRRSVKHRNIINVYRKFKLIIHGWTGNGNLQWIQNMKDQYLKKGKYNIISVDWSKPADCIYSIAVSNSNQVAKYISEFLIRLHKTYRISYQNFHLIGHSLGAHVAGSAGKYLINKEGRKYNRITGLDPAGPLFRFLNQDIRLSKEDANLVDVIHTDGYLCGYYSSLGHVDFYINAGIGPQPGCLDLPILFTSKKFGMAVSSYQDGVCTKWKQCQCGNIFVKCATININIYIYNYSFSVTIKVNVLEILQCIFELFF